MPPFLCLQSGNIKLPEMGAYDVLVEQMVERIHNVLKGHKYNPSGQGLYGLGLPCHSSLVLAGLC